MSEVLARYKQFHGSAYAMGVRCQHCGDTWGRHLGTDCLGGGTLFEPVSMTPTLDKLEAEKEEDFSVVADFMNAIAADPEPYKFHQADAAMIARDGRQKMTVVKWPSLDSLKLIDDPFKSTAHPAIPGLTRMSAQDHRLGMGIR